MPLLLAPPFEKAEEIVSRHFEERRHEPERGTIEVFGQRYILVRGASLSVEFFTLVKDLYGPGRENEADDFARNILYDLAHAIGKSDAQDLHAKMNLVDPMDRGAAGPVHFAHAGWAFVDISNDSDPAPGENFHLVYEHPYSFESDAWIGAGRTSEFPVCIMSAGYSSGWGEVSFGLNLVASEILCRAKGDDCCRFVMAHPERIESAIARYVDRKELAKRVGSYQIPDFFVRKRIEEELRRNREDLEARVEERTRELREANERLRREIEERSRVEERLRRTQKLEAVGRLAGGIAHDFNNIMSVILSRSALAANRLGAQDPMHGELAEIAHAAQRAATLTRNLLAFSRGQILTKEILDLNALVPDVARLLRPLIGEDVELETRLGAGIGSVEADRGQVEQVITNLVVNARDAMPAGGTLTIETGSTEVAAAPGDAPAAGDAPELAPGRYVTLTVSDMGAGMDEDTLARVFEPFFTTKKDGTGLGLSIVYGIVKQSGGHVSVESAKGRGARFTIWLPAVETPPRGGPLRDRAKAGALDGDEALLLVEDQDGVRASIRAVLEFHGYKVREAKNAAAAIAIAEQDRAIDLVITDIVMPRMSGRELAERLAELRPELKVIFMSGYAEDFALEGHAIERAAAFLQKPFLPDALLGKIRELLD